MPQRLGPEKRLYAFSQFFRMLELQIGHVTHIFQIPQQGRLDRRMFPYQEEEEEGSASSSEDVIAELERAAFAHPAPDVDDRHRLCRAVAGDGPRSAAA